MSAGKNMLIGHSRGFLFKPTKPKNLTKNYVILYMHELFCTKFESLPQKPMQFKNVITYEEIVNSTRCSGILLRLG